MNQTYGTAAGSRYLGAVSLSTGAATATAKLGAYHLVCLESMMSQTYCRAAESVTSAAISSRREPSVPDDARFGLLATFMQKLIADR